VESVESAAAAAAAEQINSNNHPRKSLVAILFCLVFIYWPAFVFLYTIYWILYR